MRHVQDMTHDVTRALIRHDERENRRKEQIITIGYVKIMWGFMQTLNAFVHVFRVRWPSLLWRLFQTFGFTDLHISVLDSLQCVLSVGTIKTAEINALIFGVPVCTLYFFSLLSQRTHSNINEQLTQTSTDTRNMHRVCDEISSSSLLYQRT